LEQQAASQMKCCTYLLLLLLPVSQVDDTLAVTSNSSVAPLAPDNDEYLPVQRRPREEESASDQGRMLVSIKVPLAACLLVARAAPVNRASRTPFTPPPLYAFMSLQI
jgi:hypothetical protein